MKPSASAIVLLTALLGSLSPGLLPAGERGPGPQAAVAPAQVEETLKLALDSFKKGEPAESIRLLAKGIMLIRQQMPLNVLKLCLCDEVRDYNDYDAKAGFALKAGEPLLLYIEPEGFGVSEQGREYSIWLTQDVEIKDGAGEVIFQQNNWVDYKKSFPTPVIPFYITNRIRDIPAGKYTYTFTLKDHLKNAFLTKSFEFLVR